MEIKELGPVWGVILAGGQARRLGGGDKGLRLLGGRPLLAHIVDRLQSQVAGLVLNANGDPARFAAFGLPVAADSVAGFAGPLAGLLAGFDWVAAHQPSVKWILTAPGDSPFLPGDLATRLASALTAGGRAAIAASGERQHPVFGLWSMALRDDLRQAVVQDEMRRMGDWLRRCQAAVADFPTRQPDPFFNINTPEDLDQAAGLLGPGQKGSSK